MGLPDRPDNLEVEPLKLTAEHFPLPCSLRELVLQRYAESNSIASDIEPMEPQELMAYLHGTTDLALTPMQSILAQTESIGDPALPTNEQMAILDWVGSAFDTWEEQFPLEPDLLQELRRLKPLVAALALTEPDFLTPGGHHLHLMLDSLQLAAVGWQARTGRAGQGVQKQVGMAVEEALKWFETPGCDLDGLCTRVVADTERDLARASRMAQRMAEAETGRVKTAEAKRVAADMINEALQEFSAPPTIGTFLKGPWYDSAQLVLLKFGADSEQWAHMSAATSSLLDSVQAPKDEEDPGRRQHLFEIVTQLPRELRRWLLSLQHDSDAIENAMGMVEYAHMQILRKRPLDMEQIPLLGVAGAGGAGSAPGALASVREGQWFSVDLGDGDPVRVRLVLQMEAAGELMFANLAGIKVLQQSYEAFSALLDSGSVTSLDSGASFSRSLASAAGINNTDELDKLLGPAVLQARREEEERQRLEQEQARLEREREEQLAREEEEVERREREKAEAAQREEQQTEAQQQALEEREARELQQEWDDAHRRQREQQDAVRPGQSAAPGGQQPPPQSAASAEPDTHMQHRPADPTLEGFAARASDPPAAALPMGAWLGFHDGDTPLLAKLAVHDRENNHYIFVNRSGIKMRQLSHGELLALMESGMVDVLETRSNFRDEINRVKKKSET